MNRITEYLCIATLTIALCLLFAMLCERLKPVAPAPNTAKIEAQLDALLVDKGLALTPCETPVAMEPERIEK